MQINQPIKQVLQKHPDIVLAMLFGSLATCCEHFDSDIDLVIAHALEN